MKERTYLIFRRLFFWLSFFTFVVFTPVIVYYSLGYKFDASSHKFVKTAALSIKTSPKGIDVVLSGKRLKDTSPCVIRGLLPREYTVLLEKEGFYPYRVHVLLKPSTVAELDIVLIPKTKTADKIKFDFNIYKFFVSRRFLGEKIVAFTDKGIYFLDKDFKNAKLISSVPLLEDLASSIEGFKEGDSRLAFWNKSDVWITQVLEPFSKEESKIGVIYKATERIKEVFFGLGDRYLIIQDGVKIVTQDVRNPAINFLLFALESENAEVFYDNASEILYIRDWAAGENKFSLFKIELMSLINERKEAEKNP
ncbi:MAG: PEGA domain-containing protein [Candidatus Omnitrophica bacterium]|nr:PEGA domain-containing protein [Candidatus Omnitrophota bacterium]MDD5611292.1 PEGA domain-containing protein [Candidatus Omnitrophota bacterium]